MLDVEASTSSSLDVATGTPTDVNESVADLSAWATDLGDTSRVTIEVEIWQRATRGPTSWPLRQDVLVAVRVRYHRDPPQRQQRLVRHTRGGDL